MKQKSTWWTLEETEKLRSLYLSMEHKDIARLIGKTTRAVSMMAWRMGLIKKSGVWTESECEQLRKHYDNRRGKFLNLQELSEKLGRTPNAIELKGSRIGLGDRNRKKESHKKKVRMFDDPQKRREYLSMRRKEHIKNNGHPRGALGLKHTPEARAKMAAASKRYYGTVSKSEMDSRMDKMVKTKMERYGTAGNRLSTNAFSNARRGRRDDLGGMFFRSAWEANYARYLNMLKEQRQIQGWEYEPKTFVFHGVTRGALTYTPDFKVMENDGSHVWHEVKGWMTSKSKTKLKRMAKYYPDEKIILIGEDEYKSISKIAAMIPEWEYKGKKKIELTDINWDNVEIVENQEGELGW